MPADRIASTLYLNRRQNAEIQIGVALINRFSALGTAEIVRVT